MTQVVTDLLKEGIRTVEERDKTHGNYRENFEHCAELWGAYLQMPIAPAQVAVLMTLLKFSREQSGSAHPDHFLDALGYVALAGALSGEGD